MRWLARTVRNMLVHRRPARRPRRARLELEALEQRALLAVFSGTILGTAFVDSNANGAFDGGEATLPGVTVNLSGTSTSGAPVNASTVTNAAGAYGFENVLPGTYTLSAGNALGFLNGTTAPDNTVSGLTLGQGQALTQDFGFRGLQSGFISMRQFLTNTTTLGFPSAPAGVGQTAVNTRSDSTPTVSSAIADVSVPASSSPTVIDLAGNFTDADIQNSQIRFDTNAGPINATLFDTTAPRTVQNFYNYINSGRYDSSIFHRLAINPDGTKFVLQGGGFTFGTDAGGSGTIGTIPTDPAVQNEFGASNTQGTLAMAKLGNDPNSATDQFFFNLGNNSSNLDNQNGGFTVFGQINGTPDQAVLSTLSSATVKDESSFNSAFNSIPMNNYNGNNFPTDTTAANYDLVKDVAVVSRNEVLTYSVVSNTNPGLVNPTLDSNRLTLNYVPGATGSATIAVRATDRFGASVVTSFNVTVS